MELTKQYFDEKISSIVEDISVIKANIKTIDEKVDRIDNRDKEDSDAFAKDIV